MRSGRYLEIPDEEWEKELATRQYVVGCYMKNDVWAARLHKPVGVLLTSSLYGLAFLRASVETHARLGYWTVLSYDNFIDPESSDALNYNATMPPKDAMDHVDTFLLSRHQTWGGVSLPYCMQLRLAAPILSSFEYVLCSNGDCVIEKPEGFPQLLELMGDADFMSAGPTLPREVGTASFIVRGRAFAAIGRHLIDHMLPFEEYEKSTQEFGNTEGRLSVAIRELGLTQTIVPKPPSCPIHPICEQHHMPGGTFYDLIGFRHIHGETNFAYRYGKETFERTGELLVPAPSKYLDARYCGSEDFKASVAYEAGDLEFVKQWYAKE